MKPHHAGKRVCLKFTGAPESSNSFKKGSFKGDKGIKTGLSNLERFKLYSCLDFFLLLLKQNVRNFNTDELIDLCFCHIICHVCYYKHICYYKHAIAQILANTMSTLSTCMSAFAKE